MFTYIYIKDKTIVMYNKIIFIYRIHKIAIQYMFDPIILSRTINVTYPQTK